MNLLALSSRSFAVFLACTSASNAASTVLTQNVQQLIPDGSSSGMISSVTTTGLVGNIVSVEVALHVAAASASEAFLGDLYVYLTNGTDIAILLNRPGRTTVSPWGYDDNQTLNVSFTNTATLDIHNYRHEAGVLQAPLSAPLTGVWLADGRNIDPASVLDTDTPDSRLNVFNGTSANKTWTLFAADLSTGAQHQLESWSLTITVVPEPSSLLLSFCGLGLLLRRRR